MYLVFDTETTGLPKKWNSPINDVENWPRCVQMAWRIYDIKGQLIEEKEYTIKPDGYIIPDSAEKIHGVSTLFAKRKGIALEAGLVELNHSMKNAEYVIGHNIKFDISVIACEFFRMNIHTDLRNKVILDTCTEATANLCKIQPPQNTNYKYPTLEELFKYLFNGTFENKHSALGDVVATSKCFFKLASMGIFNSQITELRLYFLKDTNGAKQQFEIEKKKINKAFELDGLEVMRSDLLKCEAEVINESIRNLDEGWRLPTRYELNLLYFYKDSIGGFKNEVYWSSDSEDDGSYIWVHDFKNNQQYLEEFHPNYLYNGPDYIHGNYIRLVRGQSSRIIGLDGGNILFSGLSSESPKRYVELVKSTGLIRFWNLEVDLRFQGTNEKFQNWNHVKNICNDLGEGWRLPSLQEFIQLNSFLRKKNVQLINMSFWCNQFDSENAWVCQQGGRFRRQEKNSDWIRRFTFMPVRTVDETISIPIKTLSIGQLEVMLEDLNPNSLEDGLAAIEDIGNGWRLPTKSEIDILYEYKNEIGGFKIDTYGTSQARGKCFFTGEEKGMKYSRFRLVRGVRPNDNHYKIGKLEIFNFDFVDVNISDVFQISKILGENWELPTKNELNILFENKDEIGGFENTIYISRTEEEIEGRLDGEQFFWGQDFSDGAQKLYKSGYNDLGQSIGEWNARLVRYLL